MSKHVGFSILLLLSFSTTFAQADSSYNTSPSWFFSVHSGALLGKNGHGTSATASVLQGVRYKRASLGVGVGYDAYREWRTLPIFAALAYDFVRSPNRAFFVELNTGFSKGWSTAGDESEFIYDSEGGFFYHPQIGYRTHHGRLTIYLAAGYKFQRLQYGETPRSWIWGYPSGSVQVVRDIERLSIQMGIGLR